MSEEELIGKLGTQYKEATARLAQLKGEAHQFCLILNGIAEKLDPSYHQRVNLNTSDLANALQQLPTGGVLARLLDDISHTASDLAKIKTQLSDLGLPVQN